MTRQVTQHVTAHELRTRFTHFFTERGHTLVPSSSLIPAQDPTLLFTNAGMNQFKDVFLGKEERRYKRAVSIQKCIRAGGKHNDLENVGFTKRHLTFFEMMGNFSFGDYFKKEAIQYAWDFLTQEIGFDPLTLYASVYYKDDDAYNIWHEVIGLPKERIVRLGEADNFWQMGDTGPCGPCSEIYIDRGTDFGCKTEQCAPGCSCDRFLEVWNLVFMQFDRQPDGSDKPLQKTGIDTGMGFERLCTLVQNKESVFETDIFEKIITKIEQLTGLNYYQSPPEIKAAFRVLADHIRSSSFAIADGALPSNEGRGYVLRKIIRRAALFSQKLTPKTIFPELLYPLIETFGTIYPELIEQKELIYATLAHEIERFAENLLQGKAIFERYLAQLRQEQKTILSGEQAFKLYDTYGFPLELTLVLAHEHNLTVDLQGFDNAMEQQRLQSGKKSDHLTLPSDISALHTEFTGYHELITQAKITGIIHDNKLVTTSNAGQQITIITDKSPFYVECGGQISDTGVIITTSSLHDTSKIPVQEVKKMGQAIGLIITAPITFTIGNIVTLSVDSEARHATMRNHTATHLLQAALTKVLGKQVKQSGSLVAPDYLRFDFTYHDTVTLEQIKQVEDIVNTKIIENIPLSIFITTYKQAVDQGTIAFFGEKYNPESVRVVSIPGFSQELCGGTHVRATGDIGCFKITELSALSVGNKRIFAVTGLGAVKLFQHTFNSIKSLSSEFKVKSADLSEAIFKYREQCKTAQQLTKDLKKELWQALKPTWLEKQVILTKDHIIKPVLFIPVFIKNASLEDLRDIATILLRERESVVLLINTTPDKSVFVLTIPESLTSYITTQDILTWLRAQNIQAGGSKTIIQGNGRYLDTNFVTMFQTWLTQEIQKKSASQSSK